MSVCGTAEPCMLRAAPFLERLQRFPRLSPPFPNSGWRVTLIRHHNAGVLP